MAEKIIFGDGLRVCPKCGSQDFYQDWSGDGSDAELTGIVCAGCQEFYPMMQHYLKTEILDWDNNEGIPY